MITNDLGELRGLIRRVLRGLRAHHGPLHRRGGRRQAGLVAYLASEGPSTVSELAEALGVSLPAASTVTRALEERGLVERREDPADRRRTVVALNEQTAEEVRAWLAQRDRPFEQALAALDDGERAAFLKGLRALADALMEESEHGPLRPHHRHAHRRRPHRD
ncbi:MAG TPA: MarR family transcriptional regulator [Gaiellaceae bacterium]|nr:MarR family transcriptional regulator [Gaiellaceae bacterium]